MVVDPFVEDVRADFALDKLEGARAHDLLPVQFLAPASQRALLSITRSVLAEMFSTNSGAACVRWNTTL